MQALPAPHLGIFPPWEYVMRGSFKGENEIFYVAVECLNIEENAGGESHLLIKTDTETRK